MLLTAITSGAWARVPGGHFREGFGHRTVVVSGGFYHPFYNSWGFYYGYPYYQGVMTPRIPTQLDIQVATIKNDYADKIKSVKLDESLTRAQRREEIKTFKRERNLDVLNAERAYYKS